MTRSRPRRGRSLRTRLVAVVLVVLASALTVIAVTTALTVRSYLQGQLRAELSTAHAAAVSGASLSGRSAPFGPGGPSGQPGADDDPGDDTDTGDTNADGPPRRFGPRGGGGPGPGDELLVRVRDGAAVLAQRQTRQGVAALAAADAADLAAAVSPDRPPQTRDVDGWGYLLVASTDDAGETVISGISTAFAQGVVRNLVVTEVVVAAVVLLGAGAVGLVLVRRELRPLDRVAATASRVAALPLDRGEVALAERVPDPDPATEVGQVGAALNRMLDHVDGALTARQASETRLRRFVADASHELRTPLAAIRGYAELTRRTPLPDDAAHAVGRIGAQAERMSALVEDLLLLARLDAGRPLEREPVDLTRLVLDAVGDAHVAGPDHRFALQLPDEPVEVTGDAGRLAQVVTNLLANARTHTPAGTTVTTGLAVDPDGVRLTVADDGPGVPDELRPRLFERFARGSSGRTRDPGGTGSTGLGLAIVDAVVAAHGGRVTLDDGPGARFTVHLPFSGTSATGRVDGPRADGVEP